MNVVSLVMNNFKNDNRVLKEAISLRKIGMDVKVIALHDGDSNLLEYDELNKIKVHRIKLTTKTLPKSLLFQGIKYVEFFCKAVKECFNADVIHCNDLEPLPIAIASKLLRINKCKVVYDAHEYETEVGRIGIAKKVSELLERYLIKYVDGVITVNNSIAEIYKNNYDIESPKVVMNAPNKFFINKKYDKLREDLGISKDKKIFLYQGALSKGRGIEQVIKAFSKLDSNKEVLVFMGYGELENLTKEFAQKYDNIYFHKAVSPDELLSYTASADYGIALIMNTCKSYYYCLPNKFFEYAMVGLPIISSNFPEMENFMNKYNIGITVNTDDESSLMDAIYKLQTFDYKMLSKNAKQMAIENSWEEQEKVLISLYKELTYTV